MQYCEKMSDLDDARSMCTFSVIEQDGQLVSPIFHRTET
jgi:hypothetical protein